LWYSLFLYDEAVQRSQELLREAEAARLYRAIHERQAGRQGPSPTVQRLLRVLRLPRQPTATRPEEAGA
jgi:hypothetical protein